MKQSVLLSSILGICLCFTSCAGLDAPNRPPDPIRDLKKYTFVASIPVIRPSTIGSAKVKSDSMALVTKHKKANVVAHLVNGKPKLQNDPTSDDGWLDSINSRGRWKAKGWNFDSETTALVYLRWVDSVGSPYSGKIVYVKDGKVLGTRAIGGYRNLFDYYRDMAKLGYYIP